MKNKKDYLTILMPFLYLTAAIAVVVFVCHNGTYPSGSDTMYHIYRGKFVYDSIQDGNWYPLYHPMWYNGVELLRYWAPLPAYFMALCQFLAGGNPLHGYLIFVGLICFLGALPWLYIGRRLDRPFLGAMIGLLWFFMPNNLLALFVEGNLARSLCMVFLPLFIYGVCSYMQDRSWKKLVLVTFSFSMMILCHLGYAGMIALAVLLYFLIHTIANGRTKAVRELILAIVFGFAILGIWVFPSLNGGITSMDSSENMKNFFQSASISLNPMERLESHNGNFYFGLASLILAVVGGICSYKKTRSGFWTAVVIFICTTTSMYPVLKILPGSQYLWMLRFISIALCLILYHFLLWDTLKKPMVVALFLLLALDTIPSLSMIYGNQSGITVDQRLNQQQEQTLIRKGQQITKQRMALLDESTLGATGAWLVSAWNQPTAGTFGAGWEGANTSTNIAQLNRALSGGKFPYLFDRCKELGNDSVIVQVNQIDLKLYTLDELDQAAEAVGYKLTDSNKNYRLYHMDTSDHWGTVTHYDAIGIGTAAASASLTFPQIKETASSNLNDYTFEQLSQYKTVYLAGFTYDDRSTAEDLVTRLSEAGVRVVISADGMPQDRKTHDQSFLGVSCNTILFSNGFPILNTKIGQISTDLFPQGFTSWQTVYLEGLDQSYGSLYDNDLMIHFYGTVKNDNIVMIGLNLPYFYSLTDDRNVAKLLEGILGISPEALPKRQLVPLTVNYSARGITVDSAKDQVNTTLSYHDIFESEQTIAKDNNLMIVNKGVTTIHLRYPYLLQGALISIGGIAFYVTYLVLLCKRNEKKEKLIQSEK